DPAVVKHLTALTFTDGENAHVLTTREIKHRTLIFVIQHLNDLRNQRQLYQILRHRLGIELTIHFHQRRGIGCASYALIDPDLCNQFCAVNIGIRFCRYSVELIFQFGSRSVPTNLRKALSELLREDERLQKSHAYRRTYPITRAEIRRTAEIVRVRHYDERNVLLGHFQNKR